MIFEEMLKEERAAGREEGIVTGRAEGLIQGKIETARETLLLFLQLLVQFPKSCLNRFRSKRI